MELVETGYQETEVGLIPLDWEVVILNDITSKIGSGITPKGGASVYKKSGRPFVRSQNIGWGNLKLKNIAFIEENVHLTFPNTEIILNDVFLNISGASIGRSSYANSFLVGGNVNQHVCIIRTQKNNLFPLFLNLILLSRIGQKQIDSFQSGGNREGLNIGQIRTFKIPLPPTLKEQKAIATALSDVDALIHSLEALIAKKKAIKQGAMQELLTGKTRLAGFENDKGYQQTEVGLIPVDWVSCEFQDVLTGFSSGMTPYRGTPEFYRGDIPWVTSGELNYNIIYDTIEKVTEDAVIKTNLKLLPVGTFLMAITGLEAKGTRGSCAITGVRATTNQSCMALYPKDNKIVTEYLYHFYINYGDELAFKFCQGTKQQSYTGKIVKILPINLPSSIKEQKAIAETLSNMDKEIQALQTKKEKYQGIKQGMMQELLTGKTRLI